MAAGGCNSGNTADSNLLDSPTCQATANGGGSVAVGAGADARGGGAIAIGSSPTALGGDAMAIGTSSQAKGSNELSLGGSSGNSAMGKAGAIHIGGFVGNMVSGIFTSTIGVGVNPLSAAQATGDYSVAIGGGDGSTFAPPVGSAAITLNGAQAAGVASTAVGPASQASGSGASAYGLNSRATGNDSSAFGESSIASGASSTALGALSAATGTHSLAFGRASNAGGANANANTTALGVGAKAGTGAAGQSDATAVGASALANANRASALGYASKASGNESLALGVGAVASAAQGVAIGYDSVANVASTVSVGRVGHERRIVNVATATHSTDAVNLAQVQALIAKGSLAPVVASAGGILAMTPKSVATVASSSKSRRPMTGSNAAARGSSNIEVASIGASQANSPTGQSATAAASDEDLEPSTIVGWANVNPDGAVSGSRNITGHARRSAGSYEIVFKKIASNRCTYNATLAGIGLVSVTAGSLANSLKVETRNHNGVLTDTGFYLMAVC
jgi:hypothetical protein